MDKKFLNLFWVILATIIISNEFFIGEFHLSDLGSKLPTTWVLIGVWLVIAGRNIYFFFSSKTKKNFS